MNIHENLASWFGKMKRDLPWRHTSDPYKIWLSEIILQQTRVQQGIGYYENIIKTFPDVFTLSRAKTDSILKIWQGLGYYSRARNLHETAKYVAERLNGQFPSLYNDLIKLKGIGPYTAAAITSIAFNQPVAAIDGNVKRTLSRLFLVTGNLNSGQGSKQINELAHTILDKVNPGRHNQAIMELGATICLPKKPRCPVCPLNTICLAVRNNLVNELPAKSYKIIKRERFFNYFIIMSVDDKILIHKREAKDIWSGLYEFPLAETSAGINPEDVPGILLQHFNIRNDDVKIIKISDEITHTLTHQYLIARFIHVKILNNYTFSGDRDIRVRISDFPDYPVPKLIDRYITDAGI